MILRKMRKSTLHYTCRLEQYAGVEEGLVDVVRTLRMGLLRIEYPYEYYDLLLRNILREMTEA